MKEAEFNYEIEDVLASIRRLVSQNMTPLRAQPVQLHPVPRIEVEAVPDVALVLTPDQRIAEAAAVKAEAEQARSAGATDLVAELSRLENSIAEMEAAVAAADKVASDGFEDVLEDGASGLEAEAVGFVEDVTGDEPAADLLAGNTDTDVVEAEIASELAAPAPTTPKLDDLSEDEVSVDASDDLSDAENDVTLFENIDDVVSVDEHLDVDVGFVSEELDEADVTVLDLAVEAPGEGDETAQQIEEVALVEPDAITEPVIEDAPEVVPEIVQEGVVETPLRPFRSSRLHLASHSSAEQPADEARPRFIRDREEIQLDDADLLATEGGYSEVDEEALRMLVAQLIREELRGVLGERITHNVRKLVRREIQRALMGRNFE